ncbi:MAG: hypothetical protein SGJ10_04160 [Bacteroidota bacterium]|nr:hypothetical protein [Bacteroidota bacterium]
MDCYLMGDSIECEHSEVVAKKIIPSSPQRRDDIGVCIKYLCTRDGSAEVVKELDPKVHKIKESSNLNLGDCIKSEAFFVLVEGLRPLSKTKLGGQSNRHSSNSVSPRKYTYAEISYPFARIMHALENRQKEIGKINM